MGLSGVRFNIFYDDKKVLYFIIMNFMLLKSESLAHSSHNVISVSSTKADLYLLGSLGRIGQAVQKRSGRVTKRRGTDVGD